MGQSSSTSGVVVWGAEDTGTDSTAEISTTTPTSPLVVGSLALSGGNSSGFSVSQSSLPRLVEGFKSATLSSVSCGGKSFCSISQTGELFTWGIGDKGQLGLGERKEARGPKVVRFFSNKIVRVVSCAVDHTACCLEDGTAYSWGSALHGRLGVDITEIPRSEASGGDSFSDDSGQIIVQTPKLIKALVGVCISDVSCGTFHTAFLTDLAGGSSLYTCGLGLSGRLGHGDEVDQPTPVRVKALDGITVTSISCGGHHTACVTSAGLLYIWGGAGFGKLGIKNRHCVLEPERVLGPLESKRVLSVSLGAHHSACTTADGGLYTWGQGRRLGHEAHGEVDKWVPAQVEALADYFVLSVSCGDVHTVCVVDTGDVWAWGTTREAGHGSVGIPPNVPTPISLLAGKGLVQVSCGGCKTLALCDLRRVSVSGHKDEPSSGTEYGSKQESSNKQINSNLPKQSSNGDSIIKAGALVNEYANVGTTGKMAILSQELQATQIDAFLLAAILKEAAHELEVTLERNAQLEAELALMKKSSSDAGERLATLRNHYEHQIASLEQQLAQQDVRLHAALAAKSSPTLSSRDETASMFSLEEALCDPLGTKVQGLLSKGTGNAPSSPNCLVLQGRRSSSSSLVLAGVGASNQYSRSAGDEISRKHSSNGWGVGFAPPSANTAQMAVECAFNTGAAYCLRDAREISYASQRPEAESGATDAPGDSIPIFFLGNHEK